MIDGSTPWFYNISARLTCPIGFGGHFPDPHIFGEESGVADVCLTRLKLPLVGDTPSRLDYFFGALRLNGEIEESQSYKRPFGSVLIERNHRFSFLITTVSRVVALRFSILESRSCPILHSPWRLH